MKVKLDNEFWDELFNYYKNKGMSDLEYKIGDINCWAFNSTEEDHKGEKVFSFCKPFAHPLVGYVEDNTIFDTLQYAILDNEGKVIVQGILPEEKHCNCETEKEDKCC